MENKKRGRKAATQEATAPVPVRPPIDVETLPAEKSGSDAPARQEEMFPGAIALHQSFTGPLPPPKLLSEYDQVLPGLAERIVKMAETEGNHRRSVESRLVRLSEWGIGSALLIALVLAAGGFTLLWNGKTLEGLTPLVLAVGGLVTVFVTRRNSGPPADTTDEDPDSAGA